MKRTAIFVMMFFFSFAAGAQTDDSAEERAMEIADKISCVVCSDPHIEQATDETAEDLRFFIRKQLKNGKTPEAVLNLVLAEYRDIVVEQTDESETSEDPLWVSVGSAVLFFGAMAFYVRRRARFFESERNVS